MVPVASAEQYIRVQLRYSEEEREMMEFQQAALFVGCLEAAAWPFAGS